MRWWGVIGGGFSVGSISRRRYPQSPSAYANSFNDLSRVAPKVGVAAKPRMHRKGMWITMWIKLHIRIHSHEDHSNDYRRPAAGSGR